MHRCQNLVVNQICVASLQLHILDVTIIIGNWAKGNFLSNVVVKLVIKDVTGAALNVLD